MKGGSFLQVKLTEEKWHGNLKKIPQILLQVKTSQMIYFHLFLSFTFAFAFHFISWKGIKTKFFFLPRNYKVRHCEMKLNYFFIFIHIN